MVNNIVVVYEEDPAIRQAVKNTLEADGYVVRLAFNLTDLVSLAAEYSPWLLVLAENATGSGPDPSLREKLPNPDIPIITLANWFQGMRGLPHGNDIILTKPCNPQELKLLVQHLYRSNYP